MKKIFVIMFVALCMCVTESFAQKNQKMLKAEECYIYGVVFDLKDSVMYFTEVRPLENAWYDKSNNFLYARGEYSVMLRNYAATSGVKDPTAFVTYAYKRKKIEKEYMKMRTKAQKDGYLVKYINSTDFAFKAIEYVESE